MEIRGFDAFDLPDWLGTDAVTWTSTTKFDGSARISGQLKNAAGLSRQLDLLAVDAAYPSPVCPEPERRAAHQAWQFGEVLLFEVDGHLAAAAPGTRFDANLACEVVRRVAKSVGAPSNNFTVSIAL
ncbi:MAG: hypothetical protein H0T14_04680 [Nocardioidaceae bacterium]|nr:hypothetical protein [Nocardioidaceae bacterium]